MIPNLTASPALPAPSLSRPLDLWHRRTIRAVVALGLTPADWRAALAVLEPDSADGLRLGATLDRLVAMTKTRPLAPVIVADTLDARLRDAASELAGRSFVDLAKLWARRRAVMSGRGVAALLWVVAREPSGAFRKLEAQLVDDVEVLALQSLSAVAHLRACARTVGGSV